MSDNKEYVINHYKIQKDLELKVTLLKMEIEALRSVISEMDNDNTCYTQWQKAEAIAQLRNHLK